MRGTQNSAAPRDTLPRSFLTANYSLYVMNRDGTGAHPLINCLGNSGYPLCSVDWFDWAPDSARLVASRAPTVSPPVSEQIVVVNRDGSGARVLRDGGRPFWSPDDKKIGSILLALGVKVNGLGPLQISNADGTRLRTVLPLVAFADWQPLPKRSAR